MDGIKMQNQQCFNQVNYTMVRTMCMLGISLFRTTITVVARPSDNYNLILIHYIADAAYINLRKKLKEIALRS